jgi:pyruvate,water dikinase
MIDAEVSGVLFTADPVTGNRTHTVVNASWGLGEAIVGGVVSPDGWVLDQDGNILTEEIAKKERMVVYDQRGGTEEQAVPAEIQQHACLDASDLARLAALGRAAQAYFGAPQDLEWALHDGQLYLLQSRPITTLFPLPEPRPVDGDLHVYLSGNAIQGVMEPITPMGRSIFRETIATVQAVTGAQIASPGKPGPLVEAAERLYIDATPALRNPIGRPLIQFPYKMVDPTTARAFPTLLQDSRLALRPLNRVKAARVIFSLIWKGRPILRRFVRALAAPEATRQQAHTTVMRRIQKLEQVSARAKTLGERVLMVRVLLRAGGPTIVAQLGPAFAPGMLTSVLTERLARRWRLDVGRVVALRQGLPRNPTTEMDLVLWHLSQKIKSDPTAGRLFTEETPEAVAMAYKHGQLPAKAQAGLRDFLDHYGHRAIREIDVGVPRWSETPAYIVNTIRNYLLLDDPALAPDAHFESLVREAERAQTELIQAAQSQPGGFIKAAILRFLTSRMRSLMGGREAPKFWMVCLLSLMRHVLYGAGEELAAQGLIERADDVFFLKLGELEQAAQGSPSDLAERVAQRRAAYNRELQRQQLPRIITSEGEIIVGRPASSNPNEIMGVGVSPGVREGEVRVIRNPHGAHLAPGEILVAPSTDPAWTPLFLTAGGLVMEAGGTLSHGSVVAREYGIPAVVGVADATTRLKTGDRIRIDGTMGTVEIQDRAPAKAQATTAADVA